MACAAGSVNDAHKIGRTDCLLIVPALDVPLCMCVQYASLITWSGRTALVSLKTAVGSMADLALHALTCACSFSLFELRSADHDVRSNRFHAITAAVHSQFIPQNLAHLTRFKHYLSGHTLRWVTGSRALFLGSVIGSTLFMLVVCCAVAHVAVALLRSHCGCFAQHDMPAPCTALYNKRSLP